MKTLVATVASIAFVVSPALARQMSHHHHPVHARAIPASTAVQAPDPNGVFLGGRMIGTDPDPVVRQEMRKDRQG